MHSIGFVLLTHECDERIPRLLNTLNVMFAFPPIAWRHDVRQSALKVEGLSENIALVDSPVRTSWGRFSVVEATLQALATLYARETAPDWFVLLSASDYPVASAQTILTDLGQGEHDAFISSRLIADRDGADPWEKLCYKRYCSDFYRVSLVKIPKKGDAFRAWFDALGLGYQCHAGDHWLSANRRVALELIESGRRGHPVFDYFSDRDARLQRPFSPDESYYQTLLLNAEGFAVCNRNYRFSEWVDGNPHPNTLVERHVDAFAASGAHFARKFDARESRRVLDFLDRNILGISQQANSRRVTLRA